MNCALFILIPRISFVIPMEMGICFTFLIINSWIPTFVGMTKECLIFRFFAIRYRGVLPYAPTNDYSLFTND